MKRYSTFFESSRPSWAARVCLKAADGYISLRHPRQAWPPVKLMYEGTPSRWVYRRNGLAYLTYLQDLVGLTPANRVFDIGSGLGRKTWPLVGYFTSGAYLGVEPRVEAVDWCRQHLTVRDPRLQFRHLDVYNGYYTPTGSRDASAIALPAPDGVYDIVMANSVFTHMLPDGVENYLREGRRILAEGGQLLCTFFMDPDDPSELGPLTGVPRYTFGHARDGYRVQHDDCDEHVVSYHEHDVRRMFAAADLRVSEIRWGSWRGNAAFLDFQDIVVGEGR